VLTNARNLPNDAFLPPLFHSEFAPGVAKKDYIFIQGVFLAFNSFGFGGEGEKI